MTTRADVVRVARTWVRVPFRHQGRTRLGVDCVGLLVVVAHELGLSDYDFTDYERRPGADFLGHFTRNCREIAPISDAQPGDIVVFHERTYPCHAGILADLGGEPTVIHALEIYRQVRETPYTHKWKANACFAFRFPGLEG